MRRTIKLLSTAVLVTGLGFAQSPNAPGIDNDTAYSTRGDRVDRDSGFNLGWLGLLGLAGLLGMKRYTGSRTEDGPRTL